jgi:DNA-binding PucR family transcriptional regulator
MLQEAMLDVASAIFKDAVNGKLNRISRTLTPLPQKLYCKGGGIERVIQQAEKIIPREIFTWGASYEFYGLENFPAYYRQAHLVLMTAQQNGEPYNTMHQIALKMMSYQIQNIPDFATYIHPDISRLHEMDRAGNSHYAETLFQYLLCGGNLTDTANNLGLHRNSLIYRVNRIRDMIGSNLDDPEHRKILLMSFLFESDDGMGENDKLPPNPHDRVTARD